MTRILASLSVALAAAATGCMGARGGHSTQAPATAGPSVPVRPAPAESGAGMPACPMAVPGTQVAAADIPDGVSITFTTADPRQVPELRSRVHAMAAMHERHHHAGADDVEHHGGMHHGSMHGEGTHGGMGSAGPGAPQHAGMPPPSRAVAEDVDGGARVVVTPEDPADLERLRSAVRMHAQHMQESGRCGMEEPGSR